jgi:hypothetical protein
LRKRAAGVPGTFLAKHRHVKLLGGGSVMVACLLAAPSAHAWECDEGCAAATDALVAVGGVVSSVGMQVELMRGNPSEEWAMSGAALGVANVVGGGILLIISAFVDDNELATTLRILGGTQLAIAAGDGIGVGVTHLALSDAIVVPQRSQREASALSVSF